VVKGKLPDLALSMLSNRGTQVWPTGSMFTECINTYRCRFEVPRRTTSATGTTTTAAASASSTAYRTEDLLQLAAEVTKDDATRVCSLELLLQLGSKSGYTLAQGQ